MDDLLAQERSYLKLLVARIAALKPDLVLVSKTVSRLAQEFLLEHKIAFALNVKGNALQRIARASSADILTSATDNVLNPVLGNAGHLYVKTFKFLGQQQQQQHQPHPQQLRSKTMLFLEGLPPNLGATILLRGADKATLSKLKRVVLVSNSVE